MQPHRQSSCDLCERRVADTTPGFISVCQQQIGRYLIFAYGARRRTNFKAKVCDDCHAASRSIKRLRRGLIVCMAGWLLAPFALGLVGLVLLAVFRLFVREPIALDPAAAEHIAAIDEATTRRLLGAATAVYVTGVVAIFLGGPLYVHWLARRKTAELLGLTLDPVIRQRSGVSGWGWLTEALVVRELPKGQTAESLWATPTARETTPAPKTAEEAVSR